MIEVEHFSYAYGSTRAVDDISFSLKTGEIVALIGPNGAGKSTTMKVLTTPLRRHHPRRRLRRHQRRPIGAPKLGLPPRR